MPEVSLISLKLKNSFIYSLPIYRAYSVPDTDLGCMGIAANRMYKDPCPPRAYLLVRETRQAC